MERCYRLIGIPLGHKFHEENVGKWKFNTKQANNAKFADTEALENSSEAHSSSSLFTITPEYYKQIMSLIGERAPRGQPFANAIGTYVCFSALKNNNCIADIGASDHMCSNLSFSTSYKNLTHFIPITHLVDSIVQVQAIVTIIFSLDLTL